MRDLECVDSHATLCTLPMTLMSMSWVFHRHGAGEAALGIWAAGVGLHVVLLVLFVALHILPRIRDGVPWDAYQVNMSCVRVCPTISACMHIDGHMHAGQWRSGIGQVGHDGAKAVGGRVDPTVYSPLTVYSL